MEKFKLRARVRVKIENPSGTKRTPDYVRGKIGRILSSHGVIQDYEGDHVDFRGPTYSVIFDCADLFGHSRNETVVVDVHEYWLEKEE